MDENAVKKDYLRESGWTEQNDGKWKDEAGYCFSFEDALNEQQNRDAWQKEYKNNTEW